MRYLWIGILCLLSVFSAYSQVEGPCAQSLQRATEEFEIGRFYNVSPILASCLKSGFSREQRIQAYYLLTRTYLFLDKLDSADYTFLEILKLDPEYSVDEENDPIDIVYLSRNFTTSPIVSFKLEGGTNFSFIQPVHNYGIDNTDASNEAYKVGWGAQVGVGAELHFSNSVSIEFTPRTSLKTIRYTNLLWDGDSQSKTESDLLVDLPVFLKYTYPGNQIKPYAFAGLSTNLLFISRSRNLLENRTGDAVIPTEGPTVPSRSSRRFVSQSLLFGLGGLYKIGYNYIHFTVSYSPGLTLYNDRNNRYVDDNGYYNDPNLWLYGYVDDDFRMDSFYVNAGFTKPIYYPRKKSKFTLRNWFEKITTKK